MNDTQATANDPAVMPADPAVAASDPAMFASLTTSENQILSQHLTSGWYKQRAVYPTLSEPWKETGAVTRRPQRRMAASLAGRARARGQAMMVSISHPEPGARLGADQCPGTDQRGHGLTMAIIHAGGCCQEWETGQASTPARARVIPPGRRRVGNHLAADPGRTRTQRPGNGAGKATCRHTNLPPAPVPETKGRLRRSRRLGRATRQS